MGKVVKKVAPIAGPILGALIPGVGPIIGSAIGGGLGGAVSGGGLKGILSGAALGGLGGSLTNGFSGILGKAAHSLPAGVSGPVTSGSGLRGILSGGGLGALKNTASGLSSLVSGDGTGGAGIQNLARIGGSIYGASQEDDAAKKARAAMVGSIQPYNEIGLGAQKQLSENLSAGFNPGDLTKDPGYQFRLQQGLDAQNASLAAQGLSQSGGALKAAQEYGQNFAANEYSNAYDRWLAQNSQLGGVGNQGLQTAAATGNTLGNYYQQQAERKNRRISEILSGLGYGA